jgi:hypothetical protein
MTRMRRKKGKTRTKRMKKMNRQRESVLGRMSYVWPMFPKSAESQQWKCPSSSALDLETTSTQ